MRLKNAQAVKLAEIGRLPVVDFCGRVITETERGKSLMTLFAMPEGGGISLCAVLGDRAAKTFEVLSAPLSGNEYPAITPLCPQAHLFEREIAEQWDVLAAGHPWLKPVRFHRPYRKGADVFGFSSGKILPGVCDFFSVEGGEAHEVAVGPVHAGIIEPGHFRFQCHGENVLHLEIALGYQHRGIERAVVSNPKRRLFYAETLAGDTTIGHALAYCRAAEALAGFSVDPKTEALRAAALELERLANHTGDLGALAGDIGYLPTMSYCGRIRGDFLNMTALLCGSRFGRGLICEGGAWFALTGEIAAELLKKLEAAEDDVENAAGLLWQTPTVLARLEETGTVSSETAAKLGLAGPCARASGLDMDARKDFPSGIYAKEPVETAVHKTGDVYARARVRRLEIKNSLDFLRRAVPAAIDNPVREFSAEFKPESLAVAVEEGWRGEICHVARTDGNGRIDFYKITDPSFRNWAGLSAAMAGQQISDFPLCNKSFNLSYCGHDL